ETPINNDAVDLQYISIAAKQLGKALRTKGDYHCVVVKSTVLPGTTERVIRTILEEESGKKVGLDFGLAVNPEFLREGSAVDDFMHPDRIVIGCEDPLTRDALVELYHVLGECDIFETR